MRPLRAAAPMLVVLACVSSAVADTLRLKDGAVIEDCYVRDEATRLVVWTNLADVGSDRYAVYPRVAVDGYEIDRGEDWDERPPLPDLSVTHIEMNPKLAGLHGRVQYDHLGRPRIGGASALVDIGDRAYDEPERIVQDLKLSYEPGEEITFTAHVKNGGFAPSRGFSYEWRIDDASVAGGSHGEALGETGEITFEHMHDLGCYGITRFDSHAGREIVFLAHIAMVFHEHIPAANRWLEWLRPVLCGIWPIWAGDDGAWSEGPSYGLAYITIMTMFASSCKRATGIDLYRRPFWGNHARWRQWCLPPYAEWMGFGDHSERWASGWHSNADLVDLIGRETDTGEFNAYVAAFRREAEQLDTPAERQMPGVNAQLFLAPPPPAAQPAASTSTVLRTFPVAGWAALRTDLRDPARDVAFIFRSSRFGSYSHSHANNNDFILHVGGRVLAMPSGYYSGYGSDHHAHWVWHTKSHNCLTLSDAPQLMRSHDSAGYIDHPFEDEHLAYFRGTADASYADRATRCRRHVLYLKEHTCILLVDEFVARPGIVSALQWNIHSWNEFAVDEEQRSFLLERDGSSLETHFLYQHNAFFSLGDGWDPPPMKGKENSQWHQQYHLRFTPSGLIERRNLGVILCPGHAHLRRARVQTERIGQAEVARIDDDLILVNQGGSIECENLRGDDLILLRVGGRCYAIGDDGLSG